MKYLKFLKNIWLALFMASCATAKQNPYAKKKKKSHVGATALGRNKYFYSSGY